LQLFDVNDVASRILSVFNTLWLRSCATRENKYERFYWEHRTPPWFYKQLVKEYTEFHLREFEESRYKLETGYPVPYDWDYTLCVTTKREPDGHGMVCFRTGSVPKIEIHGYIMLPPISKYHCIDIRDGPGMGNLFYKKPIPIELWESLMQSVIEKKRKKQKKTSLWRKMEDLFHIEGEFVISGFLGLGKG
jgi:hypothetical protein